MKSGYSSKNKKKKYIYPNTNGDFEMNILCDWGIYSNANKYCNCW